MANARAPFIATRLETIVDDASVDAGRCSEVRVGIATVPDLAHGALR
jgi:hypothetical protein